MRKRLAWLLFLVALSFQLAAIVLFVTLGWTLDLGVRFLDWLLPLALGTALACVLASVRRGKSMLITAALLSLLYFLVVRQSVVLR